MRVIRADAMGMCFGVRDALATLERIESPHHATIFGELVHNAAVQAQLAQRGFATVSEADRANVPDTPLVVITAHGISERDHQRLSAAGKSLTDTTCPLVQRVHRAARELEADGCHVIIVGKRGHVEVKGVADDLASCHVVESVAEVARYPFDRLGIVCQSTAAPRDVAQIHAAIRALNPQAHIRFLDTVCQPTKDRQNAALDLLGQVDMVVVVGGHNSNNTRQLVGLCESMGARTVHVEDASDLDPAWFVDCETVGVTAGTSTLDTCIDEVERSLLRL